MFENLCKCLNIGYQSIDLEFLTKSLNKLRKAYLIKNEYSGVIPISFNLSRFQLNPIIIDFNSLEIIDNYINFTTKINSGFNLKYYDEKFYSIKDMGNRLIIDINSAIDSEIEHNKSNVLIKSWNILKNYSHPNHIVSEITYFDHNPKLQNIAKDFIYMMYKIADNDFIYTGVTEDMLFTYHLTKKFKTNDF